MYLSPHLAPHTVFRQMASAACSHAAAAFSLATAGSVFRIHLGRIPPGAISFRGTLGFWELRLARVRSGPALKPLSILHPDKTLTRWSRSALHDIYNIYNVNYGFYFLFFCIFIHMYFFKHYIYIYIYI